MAFCEINGYTIPTAKGGDENDTFIGDHKRALSGASRRNYKAIKKDLELVTTPQIEMNSEAIRGAILGLGHSVPFNENVYSTKGMYAGAAPVASFHEVAADGDPVETSVYNGATYSLIDEYKFGDGCLGAYDSTVNVLTADQRDCENGTTGFGTVLGGVTIATDTANYWEQTHSIKVTIPITGGGIQLNPDYNPGVGSDGKTFVASAYVKGNAGGESVNISLTDVTNANDTNHTYTLTNANTWYRLHVIHTISGGDSAALDIRIGISGAAGIIFVDGYQLEEQDFLTTWVDGTRASDHSLYYSSLFTEALYNDFSINLWTPGPSYDSVGGVLLDMWSSWDDGRINLSAQWVSGTNTISLTSLDSTSSTILNYATNPWDGTWKMITIVIRRNPESSETNYELYIDGSSVKTGTITTFPEAAPSRLYVGGLGSLVFNGLIDDFLVVPFAANADMVDAWYNLGKAMSPLPKLYLTGDCIDESERTVIGEITGEAFVGVYSNSAWRPNAVSNRFMLREF